MFARAVIEAPDDVFAAKPLTFLPLDQSSSYRWRAAAESVGIPVPGPDNVKGEVFEFPDAESARNAEQLARANATGRYIRERYAVGGGYGPDGSDALPDQPAGDFPGDDSARLAAEIANIGTEPVPDDAIFRRRGQEVTEGDARPGDMVHSGESNRMIGVVVAVHPDGSKDMVTGPQSLPIMLALTEEATPAESAGIPLDAEAPPRVSVSPADARPGDILVADGSTYLVLDTGKVLDPETGETIPMDRTPAVTGSDDGFFRAAAGRDGEWAQFVENLPDGYRLEVSTGLQPLDPLKLVRPPVSSGPDRAENKRHLANVATALSALHPVAPPKFPQLSAESEDQIDVPALVREMGGSPHAGELLDRVVPMSIMSRALVAAISSGAVTLHADSTVTVPEPATGPTFDLPASATRPNVERRDPADAAELWKDTTFHVGVGTEGPVTWSPAEAGSMLVTGSTGSGSAVFVQGAVTDARISGWDIIWLDRHIDADAYAKTIANAHTLSARRTANSAPVLFVLEEFQAFFRTFTAASDKAKVAKLSNQMLDLLELATTSRVHLLLVTHDLYAQTIPSTWLPHFGAAIAMGQPSGMTLRKLAGGVKVPSEAFPHGVRGRAAFFDRTQPGTYQVVQTYLPTQAKDSLAFIFGDEINTMDPELARKLAERPGRPMTPHEYIAGINGGPKLWHAVGEMPTEVPIVGQALNSLFGRPANASTADQSKPNHFYFDSLGDPATCTGDHNHPDPDHEPSMNIRLRAEHQLASLPEQSDRGDISPKGAWRERLFPIGVNHLGRTVFFSPAEDGPLLVLGAAHGALVRGLTRTAREDLWEVELIERQKTARYVHGELAQVVAEIDHLRISKMTRGVPKLVILEANLFTDWSEEWRARISDQITRLIEAGPSKGVHTVLVCDERQKQFILPLAKRGGAVIFDGPPTAEDASVLLGQDAFIAAGRDEPAWKGSGKMLLMRAADEGGVRSAPEPFRAFVDAPESQESWD